MKIIQITDPDHGKDTIEQTTILVTDFWASWCKPCHTLGKTMRKIAAVDEETNKYTAITLSKIDTESKEFQDLAVELQITSIPTLMVFIEGILVSFGTQDRILGALPREDVERLFDLLVAEVTTPKKVETS